MNAVLPRTALIRAMPNMPCLIGEGMTVLAAEATGDRFTRGDGSGKFCGSGRTRILEEKHLDAVTRSLGVAQPLAL